MKFNFFVLIVFFLILNKSFSQLSPIIDGNKIGYIDSTGTVVIPTDYVAEIQYELKMWSDFMFVDIVLPNWSFFNGNSVTLKHNMQDIKIYNQYFYSVVDSKNQLIFKPAEDLVYGLSEGIAICQKFLKTTEKVYDWYFTFDVPNPIDTNMIANTIIDTVDMDKRFEFADNFREGFALVRQNDKYFFVDKSYKKAFDIDSFAYQTSLASTMEPGTSSQNYFTGKITSALAFSEGLAAIKIDTLWGFIDTTGKWVLPPQFHVASSFSNGRARVGKHEGKLYYGYIDRNGKALDGFSLLAAGNFIDGVATVKYADKYAFVDTNMKKIIANEYMYASTFSEDLAVVYVNGGFQFVNKKGEIAINKKFDYVMDFKYGLAKVWKNNELFYINKSGEKVFTLLEQKDYKQKLNKLKKT